MASAPISANAGALARMIAWCWLPNGLPAPKGPFFIVMRFYWPKPEALDGTWKQPPMMRVE